MYLRFLDFLSFPAWIPKADASVRQKRSFLISAAALLFIIPVPTLSVYQNSSFFHQSVNSPCNSSAFRFHCHQSVHTGCDSRSLAPAGLGIPLVFVPLRSALNVCHWHTAVSAPLRSALNVCHWHTAVSVPLRSALNVCHWHTAPSWDS